MNSKCAFYLLTLFFMSFLPFAELKAQEKTHFIVGVEELQYYPLWYYDKSKNEYTGFARELFNEFAKETGYTFEYRPYPIKRLMRVLVAQEVDFKFPDNALWAQDIKENYNVVYSDPVIGYIDGVFVKPENLGRGNEAVQNLGSVLGFTAWDWRDRIESGQVTLKEVRDFDSLISQALAGRVDGVYMNAAIMRHYLESSGHKETLVFDEGLSHTKNQYRLSTIGHPGIIDEFNAWMKAEAELITALKEKFGVD